MPGTRERRGWLPAGACSTGKTSVCAGIATALAEEGKRVLCVDCDIGLRNLDISLGMFDSGALSFQDVSEGGYALSQAAVHPQYPTLSFLTAPMNCGPENINAAAFADMLQAARCGFDYIFLDAPAGVDAGFRLAAGAADRVIMVTGADPASIRDANRSAGELELLGKPARLIVNRLSKKMFKTVNITVDDVMDGAGLPLLGIVPEDENVVFAAAFGQPLLGYTDKGAASACRRIARRLQGQRVKVRI